MRMNVAARWSTPLACLLMAGCQGDIIGKSWPTSAGAAVDPRDVTTLPPARTDPAVSSACQQDLALGKVDLGSDVVRRLTTAEYRATTSVLLGAADSNPSLPPDARADGFDNQATAQSPSLTLIEAYRDAAEQLASNTASSTATLVPCSVQGSGTCAADFIADFGQRAFRHPLTEAEASLLTRAFELGAERSFADGVRLVVQTALQSAPFLYRLENGVPVPGASGLRKLSAWELATRLSYLLSGAPPDARLRAAASDGSLLDEQGFETERQRLLGDPGLKQRMSDFYDQWLSLRSLPELTKSATRYPEFDASLGALLHEQAQRFVDDVTWSPPSGGGLNALLTGHFSYENAALAGTFGHPAPGGQELTRVELDPTRSSGLLSLPGVLALHAKLDSSSPIQRGKFVREQLFCQVLPAPPANVPAPPEVSDTATTRERFAQHNTNPACSSCHSLIDPLGFPLEAFDGMGRFRSEEAGKPLDLRGELRGTDVDGPVTGVTELGAALARSGDVQRCVATKFFRYASGRSEAEADSCSLSQIDTQFRASSFDLSKLPDAVTALPAFRYRRSEVQP